MPGPADPPADLIARTGRFLAWTLLGLGLFLGALLATWQAWSAAAFAYPFWHHAIGIDANIARYGPQNRYRQDFERTTADERARLFGEIVAAINGDPGRLAGLRYHAPDGRALGRLLRRPEIQHLTDVARLVRAFRVAALTGMFAALTLAGLAIRRAWPLPPLRAFAVGAAAAIAASAALLAAVGPTRVFYALHVWLFPAEHQWFFYYQESLMSTMMRAPVLFGAIAAEWVVTALPLFALMLAGQRAVHRHCVRREA